MKTVAYVCLEYALETNLPIYAGGLGVLAGDLILETPPDEFKYIGLGIFYSHGFHAHNDSGKLNPAEFGWDLIKTSFSVRLGREEIWFQVWKKTFNKSVVYLIDTDISINSEQHRNITKYLYGPSKEIMFDQQIILAFGIPKILKFENVNPDVFHLNEGHTGMAILALANGDPKNLESVKNKCVSTKHTVLTGGGLHIHKEEFSKKLSFLPNTDELFNLGTNTTHPTTFSTTNFLMRYTKLGSAVSVAHAKAEKVVHPHSNLIPITNGVNQRRWQAENLTHPNKVNPAKIWESHQINKTMMIDYLKDLTKKSLEENTLVVTWARRFTAYKRPDLLFKNIDELTKITNLFPSVQFIIAGQTNPNDSEALDIKEQISTILEQKSLGGRICFLDTYNLELAEMLVQGSDIWLNTPTPGIEASGTSGMKAGLNGCLEFSTNDGWISEVNWTDMGWVLWEENIAENLYRLLETEIFPLYYKIDEDGLPGEWIAKMKRTMHLVEEHYTTKRVLKDYWEKLYSQC